MLVLNNDWVLIDHHSLLHQLFLSNMFRWSENIHNGLRLSENNVARGIRWRHPVSPTLFQTGVVLVKFLHEFLGLSGK